MAKKADNPDYDELPVDSPERKRLPLLLRHAWYNLNKTFLGTSATLASRLASSPCCAHCTRAMPRA